MGLDIYVNIQIEICMNQVKLYINWSKFCIELLVSLMTWLKLTKSNYLKIAWISRTIIPKHEPSPFFPFTKLITWRLSHYTAFLFASHWITIFNPSTIASFSLYYRYLPLLPSLLIDMQCFLLHKADQGGEW